MQDIAITYLISLAVFVLIDFIWLAKVAPKMYKKYIGHLMAEKPNLLAAAVFYTVFLAGLYVFVLNPALEASDPSLALGLGLFYGFVTYATFDLTAQAVLRKWPTRITVIDLIWGSVLSGSVAYLTYSISTSIL